MKVALVHDYIKEYGGAERVLEALCELYPDAPIYTAFYKKDSVAYEKFREREIIISWAQHIPFFATKLHSPLRFLAPLIWNSFDFSKFDVVITSASWYITKGVVNGKWKLETGKLPIEVCYCHTPPRWLYGYNTSVEWQRYWPIKLYGMLVGHFMRQYDFQAAQRVDYFIANSEEVKKRIEKFYRRDAKVIYPPATLAPGRNAMLALADELALRAGQPVNLKMENGKWTMENRKRDYYFIVSRLVGGKGLDLAVEAANKLGIKLKIAGASSGYASTFASLSEKAKENIEFLGRVNDEELVDLYANAKAFLALATDEDFGITPVEAMSLGTPVIAYYGGGYKETVIDGKTGVFIKEATVESLIEGIKRFEKMKFDPKVCRKQAEKFSKERFMREIADFVKRVYEK